MSGSPLVLLHGWGMSPRVWNGLRICLSPHIVTPLTLPGHGERPSPGPDLAAWGDAVLADLPPRCTLVAWSLGALIALDLARRLPDRFDRLVLFGATPCFVAREDWPHGLSPEVAQSFTDGFRSDPSATLRRFLALQSLGEGRRRGIVHTLTRSAVSLEEVSAQGLGDGLDVLMHTDLRDAITSIELPVMLVHGRNDPLMPVAAAEWLACRLPDARLTVHEDCGHAAFVSRPEDCANNVLDTLRD